MFTPWPAFTRGRISTFALGAVVFFSACSFKESYGVSPQADASTAGDQDVVVLPRPPQGARFVGVAEAYQQVKRLDIAGWLMDEEALTNRMMASLTHEVLTDQAKKMGGNAVANVRLLYQHVQAGPQTILTLPVPYGYIEVRMQADVYRVK